MDVIMKSGEETRGKGYRKKGLRIWSKDMQNVINKSKDYRIYMYSKTIIIQVFSFYFGLMMMLIVMVVIEQIIKFIRQKLELLR